MTMIKCKECGGDVSSKSESCPKCGIRLKRKPLGCGSGCLLTLLMLVVLAYIGSCSSSGFRGSTPTPYTQSQSASATPSLPTVLVPTQTPAPLPQFKVAGTYKKTILTLLVRPETSREEIKRLLLGLSAAANTKSLDKLGIPATTPGGSYGPHGIVNIYILKDPKLASTQSLSRYMDSDEGSKHDTAFVQAVVGEYIFSRVINQERASLGMKSSKAISLEPYESVLLNKLTDSKDEVCSTIARSIRQLLDSGLIMKHEDNWRTVYVDKLWYRLPYDSKMNILRGVSACFSQGGSLTVKDGYSGKQVGSVGSWGGYQIYE